jgi:Tfp pilus assembly protein PilO
MQMPSLKTQIQWCSRAQRLVLGGCAAFLAIIYFAGFHPSLVESRQLDFQIAAKNRELSFSRARANNLPAVQADIDRLVAQLADVKKLPASLDYGDFQIQISRLASAAKLRFPSISSSGLPHKDANFYSFPVSLKIEGDFRNIFQFLCEVENLPRLTRVPNFALRSVDTNGTVQADLTITLFYTEGE